MISEDCTLIWFRPDVYHFSRLLNLNHQLVRGIDYRDARTRPAPADDGWYGRPSSLILNFNKEITKAQHLG